MVHMAAFRCPWILGLFPRGFHVLLSVGFTFRCLFSERASLKEWMAQEKADLLAAPQTATHGMLRASADNASQA